MRFNIIAAAGKTGDHPEDEKIWKAFKKVCKSKGLLMGHTLGEIVREWVIRQEPKALKR